ncbi:MAG: hypothetical protein EHM59_06875 [Betaproteobacteria bacterium]|nr:MAG: hypothetical protein EHM59_06875 [Betaproteobacteria bacterium]
MRHDPEIVKVLDDSRLIDSESYEHCYWTMHSHDLGIGYFVVSWPDDALRLRYDESARFTGPFDTYAEARKAFDQQMAPLHRKSA